MPRSVDIPDDYRFAVYVENNVFNRVTVYSLNGGIQVRIGDCNGLRRCTLWASKQLTQDILSAEMIHLGWHWSNGPPGIHGSGQLSAWSNMIAVLQLNPVNWFLFPSTHPTNRQV